MDSCEVEDCNARQKLMLIDELRAKRSRFADRLATVDAAINLLETNSEYEAGFDLLRKASRL